MCIPDLRSSINQQRQDEQRGWLSPDPWKSQEQSDEYPQWHDLSQSTAWERDWPLPHGPKDKNKVHY